MITGYLRLDLLTGDRQEWYAPLHTFCEEVVIVDKKSGNKRVRDEDDVWVLASMFNAKTNKACVGIFDGRDISKGPLYLVWSLLSVFVHVMLSVCTDMLA
jgi:carotenoid cleavage dioxygenase-like enzyme